MQDPELDAALEAAGSTVEETARKAAFKTVAERVDAGKGHILLYQHLTLDPFAKHVRGSAVNVWADLAWNSQEWRIET